ncbi:MAG: tetratricopeptide repeat protein [Planctomycetota bacterium]|jgi:tetratricopeptide (TPR) repeat protein
MKEMPLKRWIIVIFITALLLRLFFLFETRSAPFFSYLIGDSKYYHDWALRIAAGDWLGSSIFWVDPLYAYVLGLIYTVFGPAPAILLVIQVVLGSLTAVIVYTIGRRVFNEATGFLAAALAALYDLLIFYDGVLLKTSITTFLCASTLFILLHAGESKALRYWILGGVLAGLCCLARSSFLLFMPCVILWAFSLNWKGVRGGFLLPMALFILGALAMIAPVTVRNYAVTRSFVLLTANLGQNLYLGNSPFNATGTYTAPPYIREESEHEEKDWKRHAEMKEKRSLLPAEVSSFWAGKTLDWMAKDTGAFLFLLWKKVRLAWNRFEVPDNYDVYFYRQEFSQVLKLPLPGFGELAPLALAGLVIGLANWRRRLLLYLGFLALAALPVVFFVFARFRIPYVPLLCLFGAFFITTWVGWARARSWTKAILGALLLAAAALFVNLPIAGMDPSLSVKPFYNMGQYFEEQQDHARALEWYRKGIATIERMESEGMDVGYRASDFYNSAGGASWKLGKAQEAVAAYEKAIEINPRERYAHRNLALVLWSMGEYEKSISSWKKHVEINPRQEPELLYREGLYHLGRGEFDEAGKTLEKLNRIQPGNAEFMTLLGAARFGANDPDAAELMLLGAIEIDDDAAEAHYHLARIYAARNPPDLERARFHCDKAISLGYEVPETFRVGLGDD